MIGIQTNIKQRACAYTRYKTVCLKSRYVAISSDSTSFNFVMSHCSVCQFVGDYIVFSSIGNNDQTRKDGPYKAILLISH